MEGKWKRNLYVLNQENSKFRSTYINGGEEGRQTTMFVIRKSQKFRSTYIKSGEN